MAKKMGLGRGLSAILPDVEEVVESVDQVSESAAPVPADAVAEIPVGDIDPNRNQPRKKFDDDALLALAESIRHNGVISPILVARDNGRYTIIAGERRWRAADWPIFRRFPPSCASGMISSVRRPRWSKTFSAKTSTPSKKRRASAA